ncbi:MAG: LpxI family protein [Pseudorhodobacter sp.]
MTKTALIAGAGALPTQIVAVLRDKPFIAALEGHAPRGIAVDLKFRVERLVPFLEHLHDQGVTAVCFAGAVQRPRLDPALFDPRTAQMVPRLMMAMRGGDDATLREVIAIFEEAGFAILGVDQIAPALVPGEGVICGAPGEQDRADAERAAAIVAALGAVDVGQGTVVQQGLCLAVEALPGTDAMLRLAATIPLALRPDASRGRGLFYKAPKPGQDRRIDLPTLGPETVNRVADAGLGGIVWQAGGVITLDLPEMTRQAEAQGIFLWARA